MIFVTRIFPAGYYLCRLNKSNMKKIVSVAIVSVTLFFSMSAMAQEKAKWNELEAFHEIMSKTFHPSEEGKLEPIRSRSQEMFDKATAWKSSTAPVGYDQNAVKKNLKDLVKGAKEINKLVKEKAADAVLKEKLSKLHDVFHQIVEKCEKEDHM
jgi:hypothetical protein